MQFPKFFLLFLAVALTSPTAKAQVDASCPSSFAAVDSRAQARLANVQSTVKKIFKPTEEPELADIYRRLDETVATEIADSLKNHKPEIQDLLLKTLSEVKIAQNIDDTAHATQPYLDFGIGGMMTYSEKERPHIVMPRTFLGHPQSRATLRHEFMHLSRYEEGAATAVEAEQLANNRTARLMGVYREEIKAFGSEWEFYRKALREEDLAVLRKHFPKPDEKEEQFLRDQGALKGVRVFAGISIPNDLERKNPGIVPRLEKYLATEINEKFMALASDALTMEKSEYVKKHIRDAGYKSQQTAFHRYYLSQKEKAKEAAAAAASARTVD